MSLRLLPVVRGSFTGDDTAPTRIVTPAPPPKLPRIGPAWTRDLRGRNERDVIASARALEAEINARLEMRRRRDGAMPAAAEVREMLSEYARIETHADDANALTFLYVFWHALRTRLEEQRGARYATLAQHAEKMMRETARGLGVLKRHFLPARLMEIDDESQLAAVRVAAGLASARLFELASVFAAIASRDEEATAGALAKNAVEVSYEPIGWNASSTFTVVMALPGPSGFALRMTLDGVLQIALTQGSRLDVDLLAAQNNPHDEEHAKKLASISAVVMTIRETARRAPDIARLERSLSSMEATLAAEPHRRPNAIAAVRKLAREVATWPELVHDLPWGEHRSFRELLSRAYTIAGITA